MSETAGGGVIGDSDVSIAPASGLLPDSDESGATKLPEVLPKKMLHRSKRNTNSLQPDVLQITAQHNERKTHVKCISCSDGQ